MKVVLIVATLGILAAIQPAVADHGCNGEVIDLGGAVYVDIRNPSDPTGNWWFYIESNGQPGLQSGGRQAAGLWSDACAHPNPDRLLY